MQNHFYRDKVEYIRDAKGIVFIQTKQSGYRIFFHKGEYQMYHAQGEIEDLVSAGDSLVKKAWGDTIVVFPAKSRQAGFDSLLIVNNFDRMKRIWGY